MTFDTSTLSLIMDYDSLPEAAISLPDRNMQQAGHLSQAALADGQQWSVYQQGLALFGLEQWLEERHTEFSVNRDRCTTLQPSYANFLAAACNISVGPFKLCLLPLGSLGDNRVTVPKATIDLAEFAPHFYVAIEVHEDHQWVEIRSCMSREHLLDNMARTPLDLNSEWSYDVPLDWFEGSADDLLLWLRTADVAQLPLAQPGPTITTALRNRLIELQPQLGNAPLWDTLSWDEFAAILANPEWASWLYETLSNARQEFKNEVVWPTTEPALSSADTPSPSEDTKTLAQQTLAKFKHSTINVGVWLQDRLDEVADTLAWTLMPPMGAAMRSNSTASADVRAIIGELEREGLEVPPNARGAHRDLMWDETSLRLYVVIWPHLSAADVPEWTLMIVLGPQAGETLPSNTRLLVRDAGQLLVEQTPSDDREDTYLYARVVGTWTEKFWVTIDLDCNDPTSSIYLPPFRFNPGNIEI